MSETRLKKAALAMNDRPMTVLRAMKIMGEVVLVMSLFAGAAADAQTLKVLRAQDAEEEALDREAAFTSSVCGTNIDAQIDWRSVIDWPEGYSLAKACDSALGAVEAVCRSDASRGKRLSHFVCAGDGAGPSLSGSTLRYGASPGGNGFAETQDYLEDAL